MITDFGNKIGGAAKDRATPRGPRQTPAGETAAPRARQPKPPRFSWWMDRSTRAIFATKDGDRAKRRLIEFPTSEEAQAFRRRPDAAVLLLAAWEAARDAGNVTEEKVRGTTNRPRVGVDYRAGIDTTPEAFMETFRPYGVEFGNWQTDRAACLNQTHDALLDLAGVVGLDAAALTFGGRLALAFGARGHGKAAAHYEPGRRVINLTKTQGAGCLAHEWFHAWDHHTAVADGRPVGVSFASGIPCHPASAALRSLPTALKQRSIEADRTRSGRYWSLPEEVMARAFEAWVRSRVDNDYLANIVPAAAFACGPSRYPYPLPEEMPAVDAAFRRLFGIA
ncbi:MAG: hypothetical protein EBS51_14455 [Planctomycetia bacterium]|nr:hypothetical protein [Planctomycetia bacterium]